VKREPFAGPGPWWLTRGGLQYVETPDWQGACDIKEAETVVQVGTGTRRLIAPSRTPSPFR
jgi:hypothetical protein